MASLKGVSSLAQLSLTSDENHHSLCAVCRLLDFNKAFFGDDEYKLPVTDANPFSTWHNRFWWSLSHLREETSCSFCKLVLETLNLTESFTSLESGIVTVSRQSLYAKRKMHRYPICISSALQSQKAMICSRRKIRGLRLEPREYT